MVTSRVKSAVAKYNKLIIASSWENAEGFARLEQVLPKTVTLTTDSGMKFDLPAAGEWKYNSSDKKFHNSVSESALPALAKDTRGVLKDITISYEVNDDYCKWFFPAVSPSSSSIKEGTSVDFKARRYIDNYVSASICRVTTDENGRESTEIAYDTDLTPGLLTDGESNPVVFTNPSVKASDSGKYFTISYSPSEYRDKAYVSSWLIDVNIVHEPKTEAQESAQSQKNSPTRLNIANKETCQLSKKVKVQDADGLKSVKLNGKRVTLKKGKKKLTFKLSKYKKYLKKKGKWNKLVIVDLKGKKKSIRFKTK